MVQQLSNTETIFWSAVGITDPAERNRYLDEACVCDPDLRRQLDELLAAYPKVDQFLERPACAADAGMIREAAIAECPGSIIGPYKLLQQIGEGGFGVVFLADQERPVKRRVALKVIKPGMDTRQVIARFEAERQALALMDHPNIAKVLDAGTTGFVVPPSGGGRSSEDRLKAELRTGRPYFVMELVQGVPITQYCDQCNLTTRERLELFVIVCQAVQHAHQKGIIHRDIKPTNVLVAIQDGQPAPKIIDFGVAKAINQQLTEHTLLTAFAQMVGTPLYMSPEQAELSPLGVDTRSDIYSLGVLLYELLTGTTPFDKDRLHAASYDELRQIIREEEPPRPSARISTLAADLATTVAEHRRTDSRRLGQAVRGELDWIVMKCLEKDRNRRYDSASSLARDIERFLTDEPVVACPPSTKYRVAKFIRRNKAGVLASSAVVASLLIAAGLSTWLYLRERDARRNETQLRQQAEMATKIAETEQILRTRGVPAAEEHLNTLTPQVGEMGRQNAAQFYSWLSNLHGRRARWREAAAYAGKATELDPTNIDHYHYYLPALLQAGDVETYRRIRPVFLERFGATTGTFVAEQVLKDCLLTAWPEMETARLDILAARALEIGSENPFRTWCWFANGLLEYRKGNYESAAQEMERTVANSPPESCRHVAYMVLAMARHRSGDTERARSVLADGSEIAIRWLPKEDGLLATEYWNDWIIGRVLMDEASSLILGYPHRHRVESSAVAYFTQRDFASAERAARESLELHRRTLGPGHVETAWDLMYLGSALAAQSKNEEAETHLWSSISTFTREYGDVHYSNALVFPRLRDLLVNKNDLPGMVRLWTTFPVAARLARHFNGGAFYGPFPVAAALGRRAVFSGWIKTENIENVAGLWIGASAADGTHLGTARHEIYDGAQGTSDWTKYAVEYKVPADSAGLVFGTFMFGKGTAWFDSFEVQLDGEVYRSDQFDFDFESTQIKGLAALHSKSYRTQLDPQVAKTGKQSVRIECVEPVWPPPSQP